MIHKKIYTHHIIMFVSHRLPPRYWIDN